MTQRNIGTGSGEGAKGAGRDGVMDLLVMENIFYGRATHRIYDLKARAARPWRPIMHAERALCSVA